MNRQLFHNMVAQYGTKTVMDTNQVLKWSGGAHCNLPSLKFYGECKQYGTPTPDNPLSVFAFDGTATVSGRDNYLYTPKLYGIGEYKDEWDYVSGKGVRKVAKIEFTGKEYWAKYGANNGANGFYSYRYKVPTINSTSIPTILAVSTHYPSCARHGQLYYGQVEGVYAGGVNDQDAWLIFGTTFPTSTDFNAYLSEQYANGTPVTVYYVLAEPIPFEERPSYSPYEPIPNEGGVVDIIDSGFTTPFEISYVIHSSENNFKRVTVSSTNGILEWSGGLSCSLPSLKLYGAMKYRNTPTPDNPSTLYFNDGKYQVESTNGFSQTITIPELKAVGLSWYGYIRDELDYITGKGLRRIHTVVMDGESEYGKVRNAALNPSTNCYYTVYYPQYPQLQNGVYHINCTHFDSRWEVTHGTIYANNTTAIYMCHDSLTTVDEWNAWFKAQYDAGTPVTIYYALAEPQPFEVQGNTLPNEGGRIQFSNSNITTAPPFDVTYITKR